MADRPVLRFLSRTIAGGTPSVNVTTGGARNLANVANLFAAAADETGRAADAVVERRAQEAGSLAGLRGTPNLEKGVGIRAQAFNQAAIASMALRIDSETKAKMDDLFQENRADPANFEVGAQAFIGEVANNVKEVDPVLAEIYTLKSSTLIRSVLQTIRKNADVVQGDLKEANFQTSFARFQDDLPGYYDDIVSGDTDAAELAGSLLVSDIGSLFAAARTQKFSDGTPMRTEAEIAEMAVALREVSAGSMVQSMIRQSGTVEDIQDIIRDLGSNTLDFPVIEFTDRGPTLVASVPLGVFDEEQLDSLQKFGFSEIRDRENLAADGIKERSFQQVRDSKAAAETLRTTGIRKDVDTSLMSDFELESHSVRMEDSFTEFNVAQEFSFTTSAERQAIMAERQEISGDTFETQKELAFMRIIDDRMDKLLLDDPTKEMYRKDPSLLDIADPERRAILLREDQLREGLFESDIRYSTNDQIDLMANVIRKPGISGADLIAAMQSAEIIFGSKLPNVLNEAAKRRKINPSVGIVKNMMLRTAEGEVNADAVTFADLVTSGVTTAEMRKNVESEDKAKTIDEGIQKRISEFAGTLQPNQMGMVDLYREGLSLLAYQLGINDSASNSVERTAEAMLPYEFSGNVRVPKNVATRSVMSGVERLDLLTDLAVKKGAVIIDEAEFESISPEDVVAGIIDSIKRTGSVSISETENGVSILDSDRVPLRDSLNRPIVITWEEVEKLGVPTKTPLSEASLSIL